MSLNDASALTPQIDLASVVVSLAPTDFKVTRVIVASPKYMKALDGILQETEDGVVLNYFIWKSVQALYSYIDSPVVKPYKGFVNELSGKV